MYVVKLRPVVREKNMNMGLQVQHPARHLCGLYSLYNCRTFKIAIAAAYKMITEMNDSLT